MKKTPEKKAGKLSAAELVSLVNKKAGKKIVYDLNEDDPTKIEQWISTGSTWLDCIISRGSKTGIPVGRITELAGEESTGKSYMAAQIAANAQRMGISVIYFDSEAAVTKEFLAKAGCDMDDLVFVPTTSVEQVLETVETFLKATDQQFLFIWDSVAMTPTTSDIEGDFNPQSSMAVKPRVLSKGIGKLIDPIREAKCTFLILNQLKLNIGVQGQHLTQSQKWFTPGGKTLNYAYSLRIWLNKSRAKSSFVKDEKGFPIGSLVKCRLEKSRFGGQERTCEFQISWGDEVRILDEESLVLALQNSPHLKTGSWYTIIYDDGTEEKFRKDDWATKYKTEEKFRNRVLELLDEEVVRKFADRTGNANDFYTQEPQEKMTIDDIVKGF